MRLADFVIECLSENNIKKFFVITGRGSLFLTDALKRSKKIKTHFTHHEQSAAFAASSTAQLNGEVSCCLVSTGCASTNTITGVLSAWQDNIPCIFISGQNTLSETTRFTKKNIRTYGQQEADIISIVRPITKYATMISDPSTIKYEIEKSINLSNHGRKGPVWIDIPIDIQNARIDPKKIKSYKKKLEIPKCTKQEVNYVLDKIRKSKRPVALIGNGIKSSKAEDELLNFVKKYKIPIIFDSSSTDTFPQENKLSIGSVGSQGCSRSGAFALQNSDLVLVLGSRLDSLITGPDFKKFARDADVVIVDIDKNEHTKKGVKIKKIIVSDLSFFLRLLNKKKFKIENKKWNSKCFYWKKIFADEIIIKENNNKIDLYDLSHSFSKIMPKKSIFICDSGFIDVIMPNNIKFKKNQSCLHPFSQGAMGYALPAIIGAASVSKKKIFSVIGDGSLMMNIQELQTISDLRIKAKIFVINNGGYGIIRRRQKDLFRDRTIGTGTNDGVTCPNLKKIAKSYGITYKKINNKNDLSSKLKNVIKQDKLILCEIMGLKEQSYVEISYAKTQLGKIVRRPLEDQKPFLQRKFFLKQMITKPIDQ